MKKNETKIYLFFGREWNRMNEECYSSVCLGLHKRKGETSEPMKYSYGRFDAIKYIRWLLIHVTGSSYWGVECPVPTNNKSKQPFIQQHLLLTTLFLLPFQIHFSERNMGKELLFFHLSCDFDSNESHECWHFYWKQCSHFCFLKLDLHVVTTTLFQILFTLHDQLFQFFHAHLFFGDTLQLNSPPQNP